MSVLVEPINIRSEYGVLYLVGKWPQRCAMSLDFIMSAGDEVQIERGMIEIKFANARARYQLASKEAQRGLNGEAIAVNLVEGSTEHDKIQGAE